MNFNNFLLQQLNKLEETGHFNIMCCKFGTQEYFVQNFLF